MLSSWKDFPWLRPFYYMAFLGELYFIIPIWLFFFLRIIDYQQAAWLTIIQAITSVIFEVPTGALADTIGKRPTLIIAYLVWGVTNILYIFAGSFAFFVGLEVVKGFAKAMYSGSFEAIVYDTMADKKQTKIYPKVIADFTTISWVGLFISAYTGGNLYQWHVFLPYILTGLMYLAIVGILWLRVQEPRSEKADENPSFRAYLNQNRQGFKELFQTPKIALTSLVLM